jgi:hypothetical protein
MVSVIMLSEIAIFEQCRKMFGAGAYERKANYKHFCT